MTEVLSGPRVFRPWRSFPTMVGSGLVIGLATGGFPEAAREISEVALIVAMSFALTEISFARLSVRAEIRWFLMALSLSYGVLGGLLFLFAALSSEIPIHDGWVLMAAVPPAIAVVPITSYLGGETRRTLVSLSLLYLLGLVLVPAVVFTFTQQTVPPQELALQTVLLIGIPIVASRPLRRWTRTPTYRTAVVSVSFLVLVVAIVGSTRGVLLLRPDLLGTLAVFAFARTFVIGGAVFAIARTLQIAREGLIAATAFASFKNLGLTVVLAFAVFGPEATLPSVVSLVFEIAWLGMLPALVRLRPARRRSAARRA